jgi:hypothetical protein
MEVKYFKMKHTILKNSLHGQIWSDFKKVSLKMSGKALILSKWAIKNCTVQKLVTSLPFKNNYHGASEFFLKLARYR